MALLTLTIPWLGALWLLIVVFVLAGSALGIMDVGGNTLLVWLYGGDVPPYMNALHLCFGIGAFIGPLVMNGFAAATDNAVNTYWLYAALMLPVTALAGPDAQPGSPRRRCRRAGMPPAPCAATGWLIALISAFFFMHMGAELAFGGYITSYADDLFYSESLARVVNSMFWGGLVVGRLIAVPLALRLKAAGMLRIDLLGAAAGIALIALLPDSTVGPVDRHHRPRHEHRLDDPQQHQLRRRADADHRPDHGALPDRRQRSARPSCRSSWASCTATSPAPGPR